MSMFIQVMEGKVRDADLLQRQMDKWEAELKPGATGYLGSTGGVTPDRRFIIMVRFESQEAAKANSDRPEQGEWWEATAPAFDGEVSFHDCTEVDTVGGGGSNEAGFVQMMRFRAKDKEQMRSTMRQMEPQMSEMRPDMLGMVVAWHGDGEATNAIYFRSEEEARQQEKATEDSEQRQAMMAMLDGPPAFYDLPEPLID